MLIVSAVFPLGLFIIKKRSNLLLGLICAFNSSIPFSVGKFFAILFKVSLTPAKLFVTPISLNKLRGVLVFFPPTFSIDFFV
ncbi:hypothetical protein GRX81_02795 [Rickettsia japonica]|uniref:Palindromic element RPE4 domain-containing protein n=1 Tax=Rickettsia japonica TaxID=35790 RepID=A0ABM6YF30_RICJA|nr:hypothetical protein D0Z68_00365 [Rickettsia japonica]QHE24725.1 hypothetical protein GRX81_02795 [Rickettsia japonica]